MGCLPRIAFKNMMPKCMWIGLSSWPSKMASLSSQEVADTTGHLSLSLPVSPISAQCQLLLIRPEIIQGRNERLGEENTF